ncbi:MAG: hypothetical protein IJI49_05220 [Bacilli bacterium]|nr:hypothetical protein [Bacilli bacterium]
MTNKNIYNTFLFLSNLTRNLIEVYSVIILYNKGYTISNILFFLLIVYFIAITSNYISLKINYKISLIISFILYGISYIYLSLMNNNKINLIIIAILLSISINTYHTIKHYLGMNLISYNKGKNTLKILIITYISTIISNIIGIVLIKKIPIKITTIIITILSIISIFPILKIKIKNNNYSNKIIINKNKIIYSILEQFKVILIELQPLYIYIYLKNSISFIGLFNIIINISSLITVIIIDKFLKNKYYKYISIILGIVLIIKLNTKNNILLLLIALLEGIGMKIYEKNSINNLYNRGNNNIKKYLIIEESIFFISKFIIMLLFILLIKKLKIILYICIIGLVISTFYLEEK